MKDTLIYDLPNEPQGLGAFDDDHGEPEEKICSKCLEIESECKCDDYEIHPLFNEILAIVRPPETKKRKVKKLVNK